MSTLPHFDYVVIGCGSGGIATARRAASYGAKVAIIERTRLGGTCVNVGCVPKKVMWSAAAVGHAIEDSKGYCWEGIDAENKKFDWGRMKTQRDAYVKRLNGIYYNNIVRDGIYLIRGQANFVDEKTLEITPVENIDQLQTDAPDQNERVIYVREPMRLSVDPSAKPADNASPSIPSGSTVAIACGGAPKKLDIEGGEYAIDSDKFFELSTQPKKAVVIGAGYIAVEMAHIFQALGTQTTLVARGDKALRNFDEYITTALWSELGKSGLDLRNYSTPTKIVKVAEGDYTVTLTNSQTNEETTITGVDCILSAIGRTPGALLNLDKSGIRVTKEGHAIVDDMGLTSIPNIYAIGDILGKADLTPVAINAGRRLSDWLFGGKPRAPLEYNNVPSIVFTYPPMGSVGLTEVEARQQHGDAVKVYKTQFTPMYYSMLEKKGTCAMKLIVVGEEEKLLGLHMIGLGVDEMLQGFAVCVKLGLPKAQLDSVIAIHPTASEEVVLMR